MRRYNFWFHCFFDNTKSVLTVLDSQKKYVLSVKESVWKMLWEAILQVYVEREMLKKYDIDEQMISVLCKIWVLIACDRKTLHGVEANWFYSLTQQPNKIDFDLSDEAISTVYEEAQQSRKQQCYYPLLNKQFVVYSIDHTGDWKQEDWPMRGSTRQTSLSNDKTINPLLGYIQHHLLKKQWIHFPWWSAGWWYSVYGIVITQTDELFIFHPLQWIIRYASFHGISKAVADIIIPHPEYSWNWYQTMLVLACDPSRCFKKYGNRWIRYLMMESGALWCLFRNAYSSRWYLEVWWWYENRFATLMDEFSVFKDTRKQLFTHLLLFA